MPSIRIRTACDQDASDLESAMRTIHHLLNHFEQLGNLARQARAELCRDGPPLPPGVRQLPLASWPMPNYGLTRRQQEVLNLLAQGWSNRRIGRTLHITEQTVKAHLNILYRKLGAADRTEAVVIAFRDHLTTGDTPLAARGENARRALRP